MIVYLVYDNFPFSSLYISSLEVCKSRLLANVYPLPYVLNFFGRKCEPFIYILFKMVPLSHSLAGNASSLSENLNDLKERPF